MLVNERRGTAGSVLGARGRLRGIFRLRLVFLPRLRHYREPDHDLDIAVDAARELADDSSVGVSRIHHEVHWPIRQVPRGDRRSCMRTSDGLLEPWTQPPGSFTNSVAGRARYHLCRTGSAASREGRAAHRPRSEVRSRTRTHPGGIRLHPDSHPQYGAGDGAEPARLRGHGEEDLRTHFLAQLNAQYEGQATGETFNFQGRPTS